MTGPTTTGRTARDYLAAAAVLMGLVPEVDDHQVADLLAARAMEFEQSAAQLPPAHRTEAWRANRLAGGGGVVFGWSCWDCPSTQSDLLDALAAERGAEWHARHPEGLPDAEHALDQIRALCDTAEPMRPAVADSDPAEFPSRLCLPLQGILEILDRAARHAEPMCPG